MSEKQKQVEKERRGVLKLLLQKNGLKRKELVDGLLDIWVASEVPDYRHEQLQGLPLLPQHPCYHAIKGKNYSAVILYM